MVNKILAIVVTLFAATSVAAGDVFRCERTKVGRDGWISSLLFFEIDEETGAAHVHDSYTDEYHGGAIRAKLVESSAKRFRLKWTVKNVKTSNTGSVIPRVKYMATLDRKTLNLRIRVVLSGPDNRPWGEAKCKLKK
ncbi:hypothetical protein RXV86_10735 [Alisedimentitalea sp. MJ-SS2]|uniref:hypothetical protein n=1 Tax=Aliisedimentitalea sp. MJ-SS2 TaxID=3049795 RepID=UPI00290FAE5D|nr:hypothetical protein [Alisedimentitalea sp. MJ-SS2]MDU8927859.1 hypothetical protein [Alisedimentitalea sp. MJ-SS2]